MSCNFGQFLICIKMATSILTNSVLFGLVRERHCKTKENPGGIAIGDTPEFRKAIQAKSFYRSHAVSRFYDYFVTNFFDHENMK